VPETESLEPIPKTARAATDHFRAKTTELIEELREREAKARDEAIAAHAAAESMRGAANDAIQRAKRVEARLTL
jgi:hypothetical protein